MRSNIIEFLKHQSFQPTVISILINPFYLIRRSLFLNIKQFAPELNGKLLDFGCGRKPYKSLFHASEYIGLDIEKSGHDHSFSEVDVYYDGKHIPFPDGTFDSLFCSEVLEHVFDPSESLTEIHRVLKENAKVLITVPFSWNEHEVPYDYARYSSFGITYLLEKHGFKVLKVRKSGNFARTIWQLWILYIFEFFKRFKRAGYILSLLFITPLNLAAVILLPFLPKNDTLFFNSIVLAEKKSI